MWKYAQIFIKVWESFWNFWNITWILSVLFVTFIWDLNIEVENCFKLMTIQNINCKYFEIKEGNVKLWKMLLKSFRSSFIWHFFLFLLPMNSYLLVLVYPLVLPSTTICHFRWMYQCCERGCWGIHLQSLPRGISSK